MNWKFNENSKYKEILDTEKENKRADIHSFHRYFGKLIPAIPSAYIKQFTKKGDTIGDLFSGSGTVAVESKILERNFVGCEINPLAHFISTVKTRKYDIEKLNMINLILNEKLYDKEYLNKLNLGDVPFCINIDHWFKPQVIVDMITIKSVVDDTIEHLKYNKKDSQNYKEFYYAVISSIIRTVSNADPQHVFPGISKRVRKMEEEGKIHKDAKKTFLNAIKKKSKYFDIYTGKEETTINIINGDSVRGKFNRYSNSVDLFITNPPYISSVRYIETMKLEMYWLEYLKSQDEYGVLAKQMVGNDKIAKKDIDDSILTNYDIINNKINELRQIDSKSAYIVTKYFNDMEKVIHNMNIMLKDHGKVIMKISESNVKKVKIDTGEFLTIIAENHGFKLKDVFLDEINENSRSLMTARNTYSDIILNDNIILWEKVNDD